MPLPVRRILAITTSLSAVGAVVGAVLGMGAMTFIGLIGSNLHVVPGVPASLPIAAAFGACAGAVLAPIAAWTLMRRVPIWKSIIGTALGTTVGVVAGFFLGRGYRLGLEWLLAGGFIGLLVAALALRFRRSKRVALVGELSGEEPV